MKTFFVLALLISSSLGYDFIDSIITKTSECNGCGMGLDGQIHIKVCGKHDANLLGGLCCVAMDLDNLENNFQQGSIDVFDTDNTLGECFTFDLGALPGNDDDLDMVLYHSGGNGVAFEYVEVQTVLGSVYRCEFNDNFIDKDSYLPSGSCTMILS